MSSLSVLPDTSVWVDYLRNGPRGRVEALDGLLASRDAMICGPVIAELLAGVLKPEEPELRLRLAGLPWAELDHEAWQQVGDVSHTLRAAGTPVALTDIEVAVAAVRPEPRCGRSTPTSRRSPACSRICSSSPPEPVTGGNAPRVARYCR